MPVTFLIMVRFSIRKKFWKALGLLYQMIVETTGTRWKRWGETTETMGKWRKRRGNHLKMTNLWMPVTSLIMVWFSIHKKFWKALGLLYQMTVETTGKRWKRREETTGKPQTGFLLNIRLGMLPTVVSTWYPVVSPCVLPGLWLKIRLEMLSSVVSWFPPCGVVVSCLVLGSKLDWKYCPPWCRGFHPRGVVVSCLVHGLKLDWKFVSVVSPKWHHGVVSFSRWKQQTLTLKSCDHSFRLIRRLHSVKSHTSLEKLWDFMQKEFPFKEQSCETALLKSQPNKVYKEDCQLFTLPSESTYTKNFKLYKKKRQRGHFA